VVGTKVSAQANPPLTPSLGKEGNRRYARDACARLGVISWGSLGALKSPLSSPCSAVRQCTWVKHEGLRPKERVCAAVA